MSFLYDDSHLELMVMIGVRLGFASAAAVASPHRDYRERVIRDIEALRVDYARKLSPEMDAVIIKYLDQFKEGRI